MPEAGEIVVTLRRGHRVDAHIEGQTIHLEQTLGDTDVATFTPFQLFLSAIGTCAGILIQSFCEARGVPYEEIRVIEKPCFDVKEGLERVDLRLELPSSFPPKYVSAISEVVEQCSVTRAIRAQPAFRVVAVRAEEE